jgi:tRNA (guanine37-N1)-methyltransferase
VYEIGLVALFPELVEPVMQCGVVGRAAGSGRCRLQTLSPRAFATDRHRTVDDRPYGGGPGMVLRYEPVTAAIAAMRAQLPGRARCVVLSAQGVPFDQALAADLAADEGMLLVAARYEGIDERVVEDADVELSIGDYVLSGGELAAAVVIDAVVRLLPGVLGHDESTKDDSFMGGLLGYPQYTRPEAVGGRRVPDVLLTGDHERVRRWRLKQALGRTWLRRPELIAAREMSNEEAQLLEEFKREHSGTRSDDALS